MMESSGIHAVRDDNVIPGTREASSESAVGELIGAELSEAYSFGVVTWQAGPVDLRPRILRYRKAVM